MWSLYVRSDQVDQQIVEINWIYLLFVFPPLISICCIPEVVWGAVMSVLIPNSTAASKQTPGHATLSVAVGALFTHHLLCGS